MYRTLVRVESYGFRRVCKKSLHTFAFCPCETRNGQQLAWISLKVPPLFGADTAHYSTVQYYVKLYGSSDHDVSRLRTSKGEVSQLIAHVLLASNKLSS